MAGNRRSEAEIRKELAREREKLTTDLGGLLASGAEKKAGGLVALGAVLTVASALLHRRHR